MQKWKRQTENVAEKNFLTSGKELPGDLKASVSLVTRDVRKIGFSWERVFLSSSRKQES